MYRSYPFLTALEGGGWLAPRFDQFDPGKNSVRILEKAELASWPVWTARKILLPPALDPRTTQPIASRFTDSRLYFEPCKKSSVCIMNDYEIKVRESA